MSYTTTDIDAAAAIERSRSHDEIVTITVASEDQARKVYDALWAAKDADEDCDSVDANGTLEVWGYRADSDHDSTWRVHLAYGQEG